MKKRITAMALAALMAAGCLAGCGGGSTGGDQTQSTGEGGEVVINYPTFQVGVNTSAPVVAQLVEEFNEEYKGKYRIEIEEIPGDANYLEKMKVMISGGELPPVVYGGGEKLLDLALAKDLVVDLTPYVEADPEWKANYSEEALAVDSRDGKIYASSNELQLIGYFYNKELFDQVGIKPAETWDEFFSNCDKLLAAGITPLSMDTGDGAWCTQLLMGAMIATSGDEGLEFMKTSEPDNYSVQPVIDAAATIQEMFQKYTTKDAVGGVYENAANNFFSENTAMIANGTWMIGDFSDTTKTAEGFDQKVGVAAFPGPYVYYAPLEGMFVTKQDDPALEEASVEMVKFFTSKHAQQLGLETQGMLPASPEVAVTDAAKEKFPLLAEFLEMSQSIDTRSNNFTGNMYSNVKDVVSQQMPALATGDITPEQFCQALTDAAQKNK
nr:extracellular solute-binding protein [uncultured Butyricicoccus sp.]